MSNSEINRTTSFEETVTLIIQIVVLQIYIIRLTTDIQGVGSYQDPENRKSV